MVTEVIFFKSIDRLCRPAVIEMCVRVRENTPVNDFFSLFPFSIKKTVFSHRAITSPAASQAGSSPGSFLVAGSLTSCSLILILLYRESMDSLTCARPSGGREWAGRSLEALS